MMVDALRYNNNNNDTARIKRAFFCRLAAKKSDH